MHQRRRHSGFSLAELLMVVALMGILAAVAIPNLSAGARDQLQAAGRIVAADMSYGNGLALANNSRYRFTFDVAENLYKLEHSGTNPALDILPLTPFRSPQDPSDVHVFDLDELPQLGGRVRLAGAASGGNSPQRLSQFEFDALGAVTLGEEIVIWLATGQEDGTRYFSLRVDPVTGLVWMGQFQATAPAVLSEGED